MNEMPFDLDRHARFILHLFRIEQSVDHHVQFCTFQKNHFAENVILSIELNATGQNILQTDILLFDQREFRIVVEPCFQRQFAEIEQKSFVRIGIRRNNDIGRIECDVEVNFERLFLQFLHLFVRCIGLRGGQIQCRLRDIQRIEKTLR